MNLKLTYLLGNGQAPNNSTKLSQEKNGKKKWEALGLPSRHTRIVESIVVSPFLLSKQFGINHYIKI